MDNLRFVFDIRYTVILNFSSFYRGIIAPYFNYPNASYSISNEGTHKEAIQIIFKDSNHFIIFRNDRISFQYDGDYNDLKNTGSHIDILFEIYEKLKIKSDFLSVNSIYVEFASLKIDPKENTLKDFITRKFLNTIIDDVSDVGVIEEGVIDSVKTHIEYGPFVPENIERNKLFLIRKNLVDRYEKLNGLFYYMVLMKELNEVKRIDFKEMVRIYEKLIRKID